ncbi:hypothetical protein [Paenibacillus pinihumi]|uniref:hypothetical protein n=1 Tax=Paenibacillus pinihumi TaxID=669462 RepID=UPI000415AD74|nr:hypothetical protein [Paenibacillus pinihumi]
MIAFIIFFLLSYCFSIYLMRKMKKQAKEFIMFSVLAWLGFVLWIFIFLDRPVSPNQWITWVIDTVKGH